jgi:hypothetical protein
MNHLLFRKKPSASNPLSSQAPITCPMGGYVFKRGLTYIGASVPIVHGIDSLNKVLYCSSYQSKNMSLKREEAIMMSFIAHENHESCANLNGNLPAVVDPGISIAILPCLVAAGKDPFIHLS